MNEQPLKRPLTVKAPDNDYDDGDDDGDEEQVPAGYGEGDFIMLDGGTTYIRKFEIIALRWQQFTSTDVEPGEPLPWCLKVYLSDCPHMTLYGEEAADVMRAFDLPEGPPQRSR